MSLLRILRSDQGDRMFPTLWGGDLGKKCGRELNLIVSKIGRQGGMRNTELVLSDGHIDNMRVGKEKGGEVEGAGGMGLKGGEGGKGGGGGVGGEGRVVGGEKGE